MPTRGKGEPCLVDTSLAVALVLTDHPHHEDTFSALGGRRLGLAGHAAFETFSVLTRLPTPARLSARATGRVLASNFPESRFLSPRSVPPLLERLVEAGITGGAVYDALVGATAAEHELVLATRDRRALDVYRALGVHVEVVGQPA